MRQRLYVIVEPADAVPIWFSYVLEGLKTVCGLKKVSMVQLNSVEELDSMSEKPFSVPVICSKINWTAHIVQELKSRGIQPILVGSVPERFGNQISGVILDRYALVQKFMDYLIGCGRSRIALVGVNSQSSNDIMKAESYLRYTAAQDLGLGAEDIYWIDEDVINSIRNCLDHGDRYNAVICASDYIAAILLKEARKREIRIPEDLYVAGMGNAIIGQYTKPSLTTTSLDEFSQMAEQTFRIWELLKKRKTLSRIVMTIDNEILPRGTTEYRPASPKDNTQPHSQPPRILLGPVCQAIRNIDLLLQSCDELDRKIIQAMADGATNESIEQTFYLAHSSLYYRQRRMFQMLGVTNRNDFLELLWDYLPALFQEDSAEKSRPD